MSGGLRLSDDGGGPSPAARGAARRRRALRPLPRAGVRRLLRAHRRRRPGLGDPPRLRGSGRTIAAPGLGHGPHLDRAAHRRAGRPRGGARVAVDPRPGSPPLPRFERPATTAPRSAGRRRARRRTAPHLTSTWVSRRRPLRRYLNLGATSTWVGPWRGMGRYLNLGRSLTRHGAALGQNRRKWASAMRRKVASARAADALARANPEWLEPRRPRPRASRPALRRLPPEPIVEISRHDVRLAVEHRAARRFSSVKARANKKRLPRNRR